MTIVKQHGYGNIWKVITGFSFFNRNLRSGKDTDGGRVNKMYHVTSWLVWTESTDYP